MRIIFSCLFLSFLFLFAKDHDAERDGIVFEALKNYEYENPWYKLWNEFIKLLRISPDSQPECQEDWQEQFCDKSIMCYATKCFYPRIDLEALHLMFLEQLIAYIDYANEKEQYSIAHLQKIYEFGLPQDNKKHVFEFNDSLNNICRYSLWKKTDKELEFNLTGCVNHGKQEMLRTLIESKEGVLELYHHIAY